jgi:hypothetical protein
MPSARMLAEAASHYLLSPGTVSHVLKSWSQFFEMCAFKGEGARQPSLANSETKEKATEFPLPPDRIF